MAPAQVFQLSETALRSKEREGPRAKPGLGQEYSEGTVSVLTQETHLPSVHTSGADTPALWKGLASYPQLQGRLTAGRLAQGERGLKITL